MNVPLVCGIYLAAMNLLLFFLMGLDKHRARKKARRIPETTLLSAAILGGSVGGLLGMACFRHKTKKTAFALGFPLIFLLQLALAWFLY